MRPLPLLVGRVAQAGGILGILVMLAISVGPRFLPYQALPVLSGSMEPQIPTGALAIATPVMAADLRVGDVVTYKHPLRAGALITHRVVAIEEQRDGRLLTTKGDANELVDSWSVLATGSGWRVDFALPHVGDALMAIQGTAGRTGLFALPVMSFALVALLDIWRPRRRGPRSADEAIPCAPVVPAAS